MGKIIGIIFGKKNTPWQRIDAAGNEARAGFHGAGVGSLLQLLPAALDQVPAIRLVGVEAGHIQAFSPGLSAAVAAAVDKAAAHIIARWAPP